MYQLGRANIISYLGHHSQYMATSRKAILMDHVDRYLFKDVIYSLHSFSHVHSTTSLISLSAPSIIFAQQLFLHNAIRTVTFKVFC